MKLKYSFENVELDDQIVAVPVGKAAKEFNGVVKLNESALEIFKLLEHETTVDEIVAKLKEQYGDDPDIRRYVEDAIEYLKGEGILE